MADYALPALMTRLGIGSPIWGGVGGTLMVMVFLSDLITPLGFAHGTLYTIPVLTVALSRNTRLVLAATVAAVGLTVLGWFLSPTGFEAFYVTLNRLVSMLAVTVTGALAVVAIRHVDDVIADRSATETLFHNLADAHEQFRIAGEMARLGTWRVGLADGRVTWSEQSALIHGKPTDNDRSLDDGIVDCAPEYESEFQEVVSRCIENGAPFVKVIQVVQADGSRIWVCIRGEAERDRAGTITAIRGFMQDITELADAREETQRLAARLRETFENISDAFFILDGDWRFTLVNAEATRVLARKRESLIGERIWEAFPEAVGTTFEHEYRHAVTARETVSFTEYFAPLERWFFVRAYPTPEGLAVYFQDVTDQRKQQSQLRLLETAVSRLNDIILITDARPVEDGGPVIVWVNDAFTKRTGYAPEDAIGRTPEFLHGPKTQLDRIEAIYESFENRQPLRTELINYTKNGEEYWVELDIVPIADPNGDLTNWVAVERDITQRHEVEERLRQSQRLEAIGQLTGGVAHDFNNLLTVILGNAEILATRTANNPPLQSLATMTVQAAERGATLTNRLLAFGRKQALEPRVVDLHALAVGIQGMLRRTLSERIDIEMVRGTTWKALVDPSQFEVALLNLVINARDAMPQGGKVTIETANVRLDDDYARHHQDITEGQYVLVSVSDTGTGMPPDVAARAFDPFFTTKGANQGSGLGLSMVYGFLKQSGGHATIYSEPGEGTTIKLYFPRALEDETATTEPPDDDEAIGHGEHVLVVEDDALVRRYVCTQIRELGYRVSEAEDASKAMDTLKRHPDIDLLFTDVVMPGELNGRQLADAARTGRPGLKVLFTSGYSENAIIHQGRLETGVALLGKPYHRMALARKLREVLDAG